MRDPADPIGDVGVNVGVRAAEPGADTRLSGEVHNVAGQLAQIDPLTAAASSASTLVERRAEATARRTTRA